MAGETANALSPDTVLSLAAKALPQGDGSLKTPSEAVALIGHSCMVAVGFRLLGLGEDHSIRLSLYALFFWFSF